MPVALGIVGTVISLLLVIIGYFLVRLIAQVDSTSRSVDNLSQAIGKISGIVEGFEKEATQRHQIIQQRFSEFHEEIELVRARVHDLYNRVTSIQLQGELKSGWKFHKEV